MTAETKITIADEGARRAVECALWDQAHGLAPDSEMSSPLWSAADEAARSPWDAGSFEDVGSLLDALQALRRAAEEVRGAKIPCETVLPLTHSSLAAGLDSCASRIEEYGEGFWDLSPERREMVMATRDAARRLLAEITPAAVVA